MAADIKISRGMHCVQCLPCKTVSRATCVVNGRSAHQVGAVWEVGGSLGASESYDQLIIPPGCLLLVLEIAQVLRFVICAARHVPFLPDCQKNIEAEGILICPDVQDRQTDLQNAMQASEMQAHIATMILLRALKSTLLNICKMIGRDALNCTLARKPLLLVCHDTPTNLDVLTIPLEPFFAPVFAPCFLLMRSFLSAAGALTEAVARRLVVWFFCEP